MRVGTVTAKPVKDVLFPRRHYKRGVSTQATDVFIKGGGVRAHLTDVSNREYQVGVDAFASTSWRHGTHAAMQTQDTAEAQVDPCPSYQHGPHIPASCRVSSIHLLSELFFEAKSICYHVNSCILWNYAEI
jgi:hypothetical protein